METDQFEKAFGAFLDGKDCDRAEEALFSVIRAAFLAGWRARGDAQKERGVIVLREAQKEKREQ